MLILRINITIQKVFSITINTFTFLYIHELNLVYFWDCKVTSSSKSSIIVFIFNNYLRAVFYDKHNQLKLQF
jgi:hypothetical protein